mgnify:FL=1
MSFVTIPGLVAAEPTEAAAPVDASIPSVEVP